VAVLSADFLINYPDFAPLGQTDATLITAVLARAERRVSPTWTAATRDDMVMLVAADMLAKGPWGRNANLKEPGKPSAYAEEIKERKLAETCGRSRIVGEE
jgi:hypothetical protein